MWRIVGGKAVERQTVSTNQMGRFETDLLASDENFTALSDTSMKIAEVLKIESKPTKCRQLNGYRTDVSACKLVDRIH